MTCHRTFNAPQSTAHHVSYLAKSEVDSKGVHHVGGWVEKSERDHGLWICRVCGPGNNCKEHPIDGD